MARPDKGRMFDVRRALREDSEISPDAEPGEAGDPYAYPYPVGRERKEIFKAFDNVFSKLKWETTEQGTRLYQSSYNETGSFGKTIKQFFGVAGRGDKAIYKDILEALKNPKDNVGKIIDLGYVPDIYAAIGFSGKELKATRLTFLKANGKLSKAQLKKYKTRNHNVPKKILRNIGTLIADPLMILESNSVSGRLLAVLDASVYIKGKGHLPVVVAISPEPKSGGYSFIPSVYEHDNLVKQINDADKKYVDYGKSGILYIDKNRVPKCLAYGVKPQPLSMWTSLAHLSTPMNSILSKEDIVKRYGLTDDSSQTLHQSAKSSLPETIEIDGEQKPTTNSEGRPIADTEEGIRNFYKWFGNSKVVDNDGRPLVVYHGGGNDIKIFDYSKIGQQGRSEGSGFEFTANKDLAQGYADRHGGGLYPVYLRIERPILDLDQTTLSDEQKYNFLELFNDKVNQDEEYVSEMGEDSVLSDYGSIDGALSAVQYDKDLDVVNEFINSTHRNKEILEAFAEVAYDGVILTNGSEWHSNGLYVVFNNNQIKSVENTGEFDPKNPNIYYQTAYAGSRVDYDRPSLEAIGTGEGNQVHGWGLYYALNRDVAEGYRERSYSKYKRTYIQSLDQEFDELRANGKPFLEVYDVDVSRDLMETLLHKPYGVIEKELENRIKRWQDRLNDKEYQFKDYAKGKIEAYTKLKNDLHEYGTALIKQDTGQVHEVDIPENPYLIDEDLPINEQSEIVRRAVRSIMNDYPDNYDYSENYDAGSFGSLNGREFYKELMFIAQRNGTDDRTEQKKIASRTLEKYGIKGITYVGRRDGRCFVIFNPDDVKVIQKFYQEIANAQNGIAGSGKYRGKTEWFRDIFRTIVSLFKDADESTLPHELSHVFMLDLQKLAKLNPDGRLAGILKDLEETVGKPQGEIAGEYSVEQQEKFARTFERYLAEGKAPSKQWQRLFTIFKDWLRSIYRTFKDFPELSPAAKRLFDKWLSFDDASNIPGMETLKEYRGKINALKTVAEAVKENRDIEEDGITPQDLKAVLNITRMDRPEDAEAQKAYNEALAIADEITESQEEAESLLDNIADMENKGARQFDSRDVAMFDRAIEQIEAIQAGKDTETTEQPGNEGQSFYQFAGPKAETADALQLGKAKELEQGGADSEEIRRQTGWHKGADGKWRFEISDNEAEINADIADSVKTDIKGSKTRADKLIEEYNEELNRLVELKDKGKIGEEDFRTLYDSIMNAKLALVKKKNEPKGYYFTLNEVLKHDKLFKAYPELKNLSVVITPLEWRTAGSFGINGIRLDLNTIVNEPAEIKTILLHEIQHKEGFARGGNLSSLEQRREYYRKKIMHYLNSAEAKELEDAQQKYARLNDAINVINIGENPERLTKNAWWAEHVFGSPKNKKARKKFLDEKVSEFFEDIRKKHERDYEYFDLLHNSSIDELKKQQKSVRAKIERLYKKAFPSKYYEIEKALSQLEDSTLTPEEFYKRLYGEIEARNTEARAELTEEERRNTPIEQTQDVKKAEAIVVFDDGTALAYNPDKAESSGQSFYQGGKDNNINLTEDYKINSKLDEDSLKEKAREHLSELIKQKPIRTGNKKYKIKVKGKRNKKHVLNSGVKLYRVHFIQHKIALLNLEKIIPLAIPEKPENTDLTHNKNKTLAHKQRIKNYVAFNAEILINGEKFNVKLITEQINAKDNVFFLWDVQVSEKEEAGSAANEQAFSLHNEPTSLNSVANDKADGQTLYQSANNGEYNRNDYAYGFKPEKDPKAAIKKINAVIEDLIKEVEKRKGDEETKARVIKTLRSAIGYKGYLARVRQARSIIDEAQRRMSEGSSLPEKEQQTLTPEKKAEIIKVRTDPKTQAEIDRKAGKSEHENWDKAKEYVRDLGRSVSDRAAGISPKLKLAFREFTRKFNLERTEHSKALEPFIKAYRAMSEDDRAIFDWAAWLSTHIQNKRQYL